MNCLKILENGDNTLHITGVIPTVMTLCGWVDVPYEEVEGIPDCPSCLAIVKYCKTLRLPTKRTKRDSHKGVPNDNCQHCALYPTGCNGTRDYCGQREGISDGIIYKRYGEIK